MIVSFQRLFRRDISLLTLGKCHLSSHKYTGRKQRRTPEIEVRQRHVQTPLMRTSSPHLTIRYK
ncbi:hypothetical protein SFK227_1358 [Shigella flexneri K-227]|uniref:Uncharacterized protein n=1 Tax=Shigella flexneri K-227 TaxID=766147 RepID=F5NTB1_SHIFL|nr:hypothetical protein SFVA6_1713 [Shigella flexneri VA-6]EGK27864.1 hypothetical protein SFK272_1719 [Shigella flexneri K-272]EGK39151.1 hypothetical protein SFK227_1358 [Shigella flexneri K-227]EGM62391.1 hypothetical protein SFJ1713_1323 [Shigella flexneri SFJ17B]EIQ11654.1 hypothetical protein SF285071_1407 [Shigella flexneri 2850-71]EIQ15120.1 hypothetical protein SFK1770_1796 [Shigella flexneri K-1770]